MRKIKVLLLDDEKAIRETLKLSIDWNKYGMEIAGEADSGSEAINIIDVLMPDLLIVDIKMPFMNGVEFSQIISKRYNHIKIIILTAYADFKYAKECIEINNVIGYILKPIDTEEIGSYLEEYCKNMKPGSLEEESEIKIPLSSDSNQELIGKIEVYINENYKNPYLNVGALAEYFGYNAGYLGALYKKRTGNLLSDRIFSVRMEAAIQLKKRDLKMYMVAKEVGIADVFYFSKCFRKYTGQSFSDYNDNLRILQEESENVDS